MAVVLVKMSTKVMMRPFWRKMGIPTSMRRCLGWQSAFAIALLGNSFTKVGFMFKICNIAFFSKSLFNQYQHFYIAPTISIGKKAKVMPGMKDISRNMAHDGSGHVHSTTIWRLQISMNYIGIYKNNEFLPFLFKYSTVADFQHSSDTNKH